MSSHKHRSLGHLQRVPLFFAATAAAEPHGDGEPSVSRAPWTRCYGLAGVHSHSALLPKPTQTSTCPPLPKCRRGLAAWGGVDRRVGLTPLRAPRFEVITAIGPSTQLHCP
ncbi:hypothetical protein LY76DRAFT_587062 [Colletotrichum caudatum]|nr:hypothetical protein LY76DRAFT_587062 [Colletotrichum caudatum]